MSRTVEEFDVEERPSRVLQEKFPALTVIHSAVKALHARDHVRSCVCACVCIRLLVDLYVEINFLKNRLLSPTATLWTKDELVFIEMLLFLSTLLTNVAHTE